CLRKPCSDSASRWVSWRGGSSPRDTSGHTCAANRASRRCAPLLVLHSFRFIGLAFLVPGVVAPDLSAAFASPAAYGDLLAAVLALLALAALRSRWGIPLVWVFNLWGSADLLYAFYQGNAVGFAPGQLGAAYFIPTVVVPLLLITHGLMFRLLLQGEDVRASP